VIISKHVGCMSNYSERVQGEFESNAEREYLIGRDGFAQEDGWHLLRGPRLLGGKSCPVSYISVALCFDFTALFVMGVLLFQVGGHAIQLEHYPYHEVMDEESAKPNFWLCLCTLVLGLGLLTLAMFGYVGLCAWKSENLWALRLSLAFALLLQACSLALGCGVIRCWVDEAKDQDPLLLNPLEGKSKLWMILLLITVVSLLAFLLVSVLFISGEGLPFRRDTIQWTSAILMCCGLATMVLMIYVLICTNNEREFAKNWPPYCVAAIGCGMALLFLAPSFPSLSPFFVSRLLMYLIPFLIAVAIYSGISELQGKLPANQPYRTLDETAAFTLIASQVLSATLFCAAISLRNKGDDTEADGDYEAE